MQLEDLENLTDSHLIESLRFSPEIEDNELNQAMYALLLKRHQLKPYKPQLTPLPSGAIPLLSKSFFPWGALPYPQAHAQLGSLLCQLEDAQMRQIASEMVSFQQATLDHNKEPIFSLLQQEGIDVYSRLKAQNVAFFEAVSQTPADALKFADSTLAMIAQRSAKRTVVGIGSGCKSGMGTFLSEDCGVINFGPQVSSIGDCSGFGLAGRAQNVSLENGDSFSLSFRTRMAAAGRRQTHFYQMQDSGFSGFWITSQLSGDLNNLAVKCKLEGIFPFEQVLFSFFGKGDTCVVANSHQLKAQSLDRYKGPAKNLNFFGQNGEVRLEADGGVSEMQIIPLAHDSNFWGADFLVCYSLASDSFGFQLS